MEVEGRMNRVSASMAVPLGVSYRDGIMSGDFPKSCRW